MLEYLLLEIGGYFGGHSTIAICNQGGILEVISFYTTFTYPEHNKIFMIRSLVMTRERSKRWLRKLEQIHFENWNEKYWNNNILDGTQWSLTYQFSGQEERRCYGSNEYPDNFTSLTDPIDKLLNKVPASSGDEFEERIRLQHLIQEIKAKGSEESKSTTKNIEE